MSDDAINVRWSDEARERWCQMTGRSPAEADAEMAEANHEFQDGWGVFKVTHPGATHKEYALFMLEEQMVKVGLALGLPEKKARRLAKDQMRDVIKRGAK